MKENNEEVSAKTEELKIDERNSKENKAADIKIRSPAERVFLIMSMMDIDYLYQEMFQRSNDATRNIQYEKSLERLREMGLIHFEQR